MIQPRLRVMLLLAAFAQPQQIAAVKQISAAKAEQKIHPAHPLATITAEVQGKKAVNQPPPQAFVSLWPGAVNQIERVRLEHQHISLWTDLQMLIAGQVHQQAGALSR